MTSDGATPRRLYLMPVMTATLRTPGGPLPMVVVCYLVQTTDGRNILIDSGLPADAPPPPGMPPLEDVRARDVVAQLADLGLRPDDIDILVCTHFDQDHAGHHDAFASAELVVQRRQYESARDGHPRFAAARAHWDHPALRYRLIDGDTELLPGLTLIETSGHVPGHQSVLVRLPQVGPVLLAIDAVAAGHDFTPDRQVGPLEDDVEGARASTRKLLDLAEREGVALVVFGHDGAQWQTLKTAPDFYE